MFAHKILYFKLEDLSKPKLNGCGTVSVYNIRDNPFQTVHSWKCKSYAALISKLFLSKNPEKRLKFESKKLQGLQENVNVKDLPKMLFIHSLRSKSNP